MAGEGHHFGRALRALGTGVYLLELTAYEEAASTFESVVEQARQLRRAWMVEWALADLALAYIRAGQPDEAVLDRITRDLAATSRGPTERFMAEMSLHAGDPDVALRKAEVARANAQAMGMRPVELTALELQLRVLERLDRPADVIPLADLGIRMAEEMGYRPMVWRVWAAKARALGQLGRADEAAIERDAAAAIIWELAATIPDASLRHGFLSDRVVSAVITGS